MDLVSGGEKHTLQLSITFTTPFSELNPPEPPDMSTNPLRLPLQSSDPRVSLPKTNITVNSLKSLGLMKLKGVST